jgi:hypothetical protein
VVYGSTASPGALSLANSGDKVILENAAPPGPPRRSPPGLRPGRGGPGPVVQRSRCHGEAHGGCARRADGLRRREPALPLPRMKLYAISDLHLRHEENRRQLEALAPRPEDWLILGGDIGETFEHLEFALRTLTPRFRQLLWVPGNLWCGTRRTEDWHLRFRAEVVVTGPLSKLAKLPSLRQAHPLHCPRPPSWTKPPRMRSFPASSSRTSCASRALPPVDVVLHRRLRAGVEVLSSASAPASCGLTQRAPHG